ncbi:unnamed protein product [Closterium sp. Yama58-4]|nr:unnamed protein product [Closterium sp. Yama58-4]
MSGSFEALPDCFCDLKALEYLEIQRSPVAHLPEDFGQLQNLKSLKLAFVEGLRELPESFCELPALTRFSLLCCYEFVRLPENFHQLSRLEAVEISSLSVFTSFPDSSQTHFAPTKPFTINNCESLTTLPEDFGRISSLEYLNLEMSANFKVIPDSICLLSQLKELNVIDCCELSAFPQSVSAMESLTAIVLNGCDLHELPRDFGQLLNLVSLKLSSYKLVTLPDSFGQLGKLKELVFMECNNLPPGFETLPKLRTLYLFNCVFASLPDRFGDLPSLEVLRVGTKATYSRNRIETGSESDDGPELEGTCALHMLPQSLVRLTQLQELILEGCEMLEELPAGMGGMASLRSAPAQYLPASLLSLAQLTHLNIYDLPSLQQLIAPALVAQSSAHAQATHDDQSERFDMGSDVSARFDLLSSLQQLKVLLLEECPAVTSLPSSLTSLSNLQQLTLKSLPLLTHLPENIGQLQALRDLSLESCQALKALPPSFTLLYSLMRLTIVDCPKLTHLPDPISSLSSLASLTLTRLPFLRRLPSPLSLPRLIKLSLQGCKRMRALPRDLGSLSCLREVDLDGCMQLKLLSDWFNFRFDGLPSLFHNRLGRFPSALSISAFLLIMLPLLLSPLARAESALLRRPAHPPAAGAPARDQEVIWELHGDRWRRLIGGDSSSSASSNGGKGQLVVEVEVEGEEAANAYEEEHGRVVKGIVTSTGNGNGKGAGDRALLGEEDERSSGGDMVVRVVRGVKAAVVRWMLPEGYPDSVTPDYMEYTVWRMRQTVASEMNHVLTTQAMLYAVGLGKGAIPAAAAVNWVLKDGLGYAAKVTLSQFGRHFDVSPKRSRLLSDLVENLSASLELLTATFPQYFVQLAAAAGAGFSASSLVQSATRNRFYAGLAGRRNFAEVLARAEAQGMASKTLGMALGIAIAPHVGTRGPLLWVTHALLSATHLFCNYRSYKAVQLRTLNRFRADIVLAEFVTNGKVPGVIEVNSQEPILPPLKSIFSPKSSPPPLPGTGSENWIEFGVPLAAVAHTEREAETMAEIFRGEKYLLGRDERTGQMQVVLKEGALPRDFLRAALQAAYLRTLSPHSLCPTIHSLAPQARTHVQARAAEFASFGKLEVLHSSYDRMAAGFDGLCEALRASGWRCDDGLLARPGDWRLLVDSVDKRN